MPELIDAASSPELKQALQQHADATRERLDDLVTVCLDALEVDLGLRDLDAEVAGVALGALAWFLGLLTVILFHVAMDVAGLLVVRRAALDYTVRTQLAGTLMQRLHGRLGADPGGVHLMLAVHELGAVGE